MSLYIAAINREFVDPKLDQEFVAWCSCAEGCPIHGCTTFANCKQGSMINEDQIKQYVKHHLVRSTAANHSFEDSLADALVDGIAIGGGMVHG